MRFTKMHGLGNDYLYHYGEIENVEAWSRKLSDRHFGIGSDGIILILPSEAADCKMRIFNADGSEAKMCGNGIRCVGKYVYERGICPKTELRVETLSGIRILHLQVEDGVVQQVSVDMGEVAISDEVALTACGEEWLCRPITVGNPHCVLLVEDGEGAPLSTVGAALEKNAYFPEGVNVEFVQVYDRHHIRMRVWERGSGITMACGTGACVSAAAAVAKGLCESPVTVTLDGGDLLIAFEGNTATMTGPAVEICDCDVKEAL